ncbi:hypothetical protein FACS1894219_04410 [Clostridia bacterium]|nr:hypothetical protein FACS1894219_04410 [Clostridia bacterium]
MEKPKMCRFCKDEDVSDADILGSLRDDEVIIRGRALLDANVISSIG